MLPCLVCCLKYHGLASLLHVHCHLANSWTLNTTHAGGIITTVVSAAELPQLQAIAQELNITLEQAAEILPAGKGSAEGANVEDTRKDLEDLFTLL